MHSAVPIEHRFARFAAVTLHYVVAGDPARPAVVLLHGWPQTWFEWRDVIPLLARDYFVVAPDMRGLGDSSRPPSGYDKMTIGRDIIALARAALGDRRFALFGHDWGGPVAFAAAVQAQEQVSHLGIFDVTVPGVGPDMSQGGRRWHHAFHRTPDLPEALTAGRERLYLQWFYTAFSWSPHWITGAVLDEFARSYSQPGAMRSGFAYYRAMLDDAAEFKRLAEGGLKLRMPVLTMGGDKAEAMGRGNEGELSLRVVADTVRHVTVPEAGHFLVDEKPGFVAETIAEFLRR